MGNLLFLCYCNVLYHGNRVIIYVQLLFLLRETFSRQQKDVFIVQHMHCKFNFMHMMPAQLHRAQDWCTRTFSQMVVVLSGRVMTEKRMRLEVRGMVARVCCPLLHGMAGIVLFQCTKKVKVFLIQELKDFFLLYSVGLCFAKLESPGYFLSSFICLSLAEVLALNVLLNASIKS